MYKCKGIGKSTGKWIYSEGFLKHKDGTIILTVEQREDDCVTSPIVPETLCHYSTFNDDNDDEIYAGDILASMEGSSTYRTDIVHFENGCFMIEDDLTLYDYLHQEQGESKIIIYGNIHNKK